MVFILVRMTPLAADRVPIQTRLRRPATAMPMDTLRSRPEAEQARSRAWSGIGIDTPVGI